MDTVSHIDREMWICWIMHPGLFKTTDTSMHRPTASVTADAAIVLAMTF